MSLSSALKVIHIVIVIWILECLPYQGLDQGAGQVEPPGGRSLCRTPIENVGFEFCLLKIISIYIDFVFFEAYN